MRRLLVVSIAILLLTTCTGTADPASTTATPPDTTEATTTSVLATTTSAPTTTLSDEEVFADQMATIEAMVAARNAGDFEAWVDFFSDNPSVFGTRDRWWEWQRSMMAANEVWTITGECQPDLVSAVVCPFTLVNDFTGPAGIFYTVPALRIAFDDAGEIVSIGADSWNIAADPAGYWVDFDAWLKEAHPDVHSAFGPPVPGQESLPAAEDMGTALEYVDEFLAASDVYPLGEDDA